MTSLSRTVRHLYQFVFMLPTLLIEAIRFLAFSSNRAPDHRVSSQRWRTFIGHHARHLLVSGVDAGFTRGVQAVSARILRLLQFWPSRSVASKWQGTSQRDAVAMTLLRETVLAPAAWSVDITEVIRVAERSPPDMGLPHFPDPFIAVRVISVERSVLRPAGPALHEPSRASLARTVHRAPAQR